MVCSYPAVRRVSCLAGLIIALLPISAAQGAPVFGEEFAVTQPDGTPLQVRIWGDEFYQIVESLDGYTLIRDPGSQFICYARLSADGSELLSTGTVVGQAAPATLGLTPHIRIIPTAAAKKAKLARQQMAMQEAAQFNGTSGNVGRAPLPIGVIQGIVLLVDFSDDPSTITPTAISNFCNQAGYTGYSNNGSVRDYFFTISGGALTYTNYVSAVYYRAAQLKSYYDNPLEGAGPKARVLILEALNSLKAGGFDFSPYDANHDGYIDAINCLYAGTCGSPWSKGLWPHSSTVAGFSDDGVASYRYQITNIGASLTLRTFCHENGHMVMNWPDLYDYGYESRGVGNFCLMCYGGSNINPVQPCAYLRAMAGWVTPTLLTTSQTGLSASAATRNVFKYVNPLLSTEYYLIENRQPSGRDASLPGGGLAIWHVDENGSNDYEQRTAGQHYKCTLVQADGLWHMESNTNNGDANDLWKAPTYTTCGPATNPNTAWWSGAASNLLISGISVSGATMTFNFSGGGGGGGTPADITSPVDGSTLGGAGQTFQWNAGTNVTQYRLWVGTTAGSKDLYNQSTGIAQQATVTGLPTDGSTIYVRLNSYIDNAWQYNSYTYTAADAGGTTATMTTPLNGATFTGTSQTFQWSTGTNVAQYRLWVGTTLGGSDISNQNTGVTCQATVTGLPTNGGTIYVRLGSYINNAWQSNDYTYTAVAINGTPAAITNPGNGSTLDGASQTFQWDAGTNVAQYRLWVGTTAGSKDLYNQSTGLTQQATVTGLPVNGSTIYVRLNSYISGVWQYNDYVYTAVTAAGTPATMTSPADGAAFTGTSQLFQWSTGTNVTQYRLWTGTTLGGSDISNQNTGVTRQATVAGLPTNGTTVYVRLGSYINNAWQSNDYTYTAVTINGTPAAITSPVNGSTLVASSQTFQWNTGTNVAQYRLWVGTSAGGKDLYNQSTGLTQQATVTGLPVNGSTVYVRLNSYINGLWLYNDYSYTAMTPVTVPATMTSPVNGTTLAGATQTFQWNAGTNVAQYRLWVGTTAGGKDLYNQSTGLTQQATVAGLPTNGSPIHVRLNSYINGVWQYTECQYTAAGSAPAPALAPPPPPSIAGAVARRVHGSAGSFDIDLLRPNTIECRSDAPTLVIVTFDTPVMSTAAVPIESVGLSCSTGVEPVVTHFSVADRVVTIELASVPNRSKLTISFPGVVSAVPPSVAVSESVCFGILTGDVNGDGSVGMADLVAARDGLNQTTTSTNCRADLNTDGKINLFDLLLVRAGLNQAVDSTCP